MNIAKNFAIPSKMNANWIDNFAEPWAQIPSFCNDDDLFPWKYDNVSHNLNSISSLFAFAYALKWIMQTHSFGVINYRERTKYTICPGLEIGGGRRGRRWTGKSVLTVDMSIKGGNWVQRTKANWQVLLAIVVAGAESAHQTQHTQTRWVVYGRMEAEYMRQEMDGD